MSWSKVKRGKKPLRWWYHKILCEFWYSVNNDKRYYRHLNIMCDKYGITLYGDNIDDFDISLEENQIIDIIWRETDPLANEMRKYTITIEWQRGLSESWDGWHFNIRCKDGSGWNSGPYPILKNVINEIASHMSNEPQSYTLKLVEDSQEKE